MIINIKSETAPELYIRYNTESKNIHIHNSYLIKNKQIKKAILEEINSYLKNENIIFKRSLNSQLSEWSAHNILYKMNLWVNRTAHVDINENETWWRKMLYSVLAIFER